MTMTFEIFCADLFKEQNGKYTLTFEIKTSYSDENRDKKIDQKEIQRICDLTKTYEPINLLFHMTGTNLNPKIKFWHKSNGCPLFDFRIDLCSSTINSFKSLPLGKRKEVKIRYLVIQFDDNGIRMAKIPPVYCENEHIGSIEQFEM